MLTTISHIVAGFAIGLNVTMLFALVWRIWHAWRGTTEWLFADIVAVALAMLVMWWCVFLALDVSTWLYVVGPGSVVVAVGWEIWQRRMLDREVSS